MSTNWKAGDKCIRVADPTPARAWCSYEIPDGEIQVGVIYLVSEIGPGPGTHRQLVALFLAGKRQTLSGIDVGWNSENFRKIVPACDREPAEVEQESTP